jgi:hypothetical protein
MLGGHGIIWQAILFAGGLAWCALFLPRLAGYLAELRRTYKNYRDARNPRSLSVVKHAHGHLEQVRKQWARKFLGLLALQVLVLWPLTLLAFAAILSFVDSLISMVAGGF